MDGATAALKEKLNRLLKEAAQISVDLDRADGTITGVPHYSLALASWCAIRGGIHKIGRVFSRRDSTPG